MPGLANLQHTRSKWHMEGFPLHTAFTGVPVLYFFCLASVPISWGICVYIHISDCAQIVYELPFLPHNTAVKHFYINREWCEALTGNLSLGCLPSSDWVHTWHWTKHFTTPALHSWPGCPNEHQMSIPFPKQQHTYYFVTTTALDFLLAFCLHFLPVNSQYVLTNTCRRQ